MFLVQLSITDVWQTLIIQCIHLNVTTVHWNVLADWVYCWSETFSLIDGMSLPWLSVACLEWIQIILLYSVIACYCLLVVCCRVLVYVSIAFDFVFLFCFILLFFAWSEYSLYMNRNISVIIVRELFKIKLN